MRQARKLFEEGDLVGAEVSCRRAITLLPIIGGKPSYTDELLLLGDILMAQERYEDAIECYLNDVADQRRNFNLDLDDPDHPTPNLGVALAYCQLGDLEMAKKYFADSFIVERVSPEWLKESPDIGDLATRKASLLYIRAGQESILLLRQLSYFEAAQKLAPNNWVIADEIGQQLDYRERYDEAVPYYRRAMKLGGDKVSYEHRMRVEMYDLQHKKDAPK